MKRFILMICCIFAVESVAFSIEHSFGGGVMYNMTTTMGTLDWAGFNGDPGLPSDWTMRRSGFGVFAFYGSRFFELNLGALWKNPEGMIIDGEKWSKQDSQLFEVMAIQFGAYLKYPIPLSYMFILFPTGGVDFELTLDSNEEWWNELWGRAGLGLDVFLSERLFLRSHVIYGVAYPVGGAKYFGLDFSHGLLVKVGLGWML